MGLPKRPQVVQDRLRFQPETFGRMGLQLAPETADWRPQTKIPRAKAGMPIPALVPFRVEARHWCGRRDEACGSCDDIGAQRGRRLGRRRRRGLEGAEVGRRQTDFRGVCPRRRSVEGDGPRFALHRLVRGARLWRSGLRRRCRLPRRRLAWRLVRSSRRRSCRGRGDWRSRRGGGSAHRPRPYPAGFVFLLRTVDRTNAGIAPRKRKS